MAASRSRKKILLSKVLSVFISTPLRRSALESVITGFLAQLILVVSGVLTARILGVEGRGYFALLTLFPVLLVQIGNLGLPQAVTHYMATNHSHGYQLFKKIYSIILAQNIVIIIIHGFIIWLYVQGESSDINISGYTTIISCTWLISAGIWFSDSSGFRQIS